MMNVKCIQIVILLLAVSSLIAAEPVSCYARFVPERDDDFAWENDKVAFRAYGPFYRGKSVNSGFDCWLKRVDYPIINKWYAGNLKGISYHKDHGEGYDPYHVGSSRGCGGLGLWIDGKVVHSETFSEWEIIKLTEEEVIFILKYEWEYGGDHYTEEKRISLKEGDRLFHVQSTFRKNNEIAEGIPIAVGITTHDGKAVATADVEKGWLAGWEEIDGYGLGTGVLMAPEKIGSFEHLDSKKKDKSHALLITKTDTTGQVEYAAGYGWEKAGVILTQQDWTAYLENETTTLERK